jgi:hypothetical protein
LHAGDHGTGVEVEAAIVVFEFAVHDAGDRGEMQRRGSLINQALVAAKGFHGDGMIVAFSF